MVSVCPENGPADNNLTVLSFSRSPFRRSLEKLLHSHDRTGPMKGENRALHEKLESLSAQASALKARAAAE